MPIKDAFLFPPFFTATAVLTRSYTQFIMHNMCDCVCECQKGIQRFIRAFGEFFAEIRF